MKKINKIYLIALSLLMPFMVNAQDEASVEMADAFRNDGKIYVVIAVICIIFVCLIAYLIYIDLKLRKLEKINRNTN